MSPHTACPFCNAIDTQTASADKAGRVRCSRCGESIVAKGNDATEALATPSADVGEQRSAWTAWHGWLVVVLILAVGGVAFGAWKVHARKKTVPAPFGEATLAPVVRPTELPGLGYLPPSTEAVFAVQLPQLLNRMGPAAVDDPARALIDLGLPEQVVRTIESASGVGLKNVDQLIVGLGFEKGSLPPEMIVVVSTKKPFSIAALAKQANARTLKKNGRTLYAVKAAPIPEVYWWSAGDRVLVATLSTRDFDRVPTTPVAGVNHLRSDLVQLIREQVATDALAWFAASADRWDNYVLPYVVLPLTPLHGRSDLEKPAAMLRSISVSISNDPNTPVDIHIDRKSSIVANELRYALRDRFRNETIEIDGEGDTTRLRMPFNERVVGSVLGRLLQR